MTASRPIPDTSELDAAMHEIHALDWTPDQAYSLQGRPVRYVSTAKIKRQVTPVLDKHGLRIAVTMEDAPVLDGNLAVVRYRVSITDGVREYQPATIYAEGVSAPGKRVIVSSTQAYRIYALSNLAIIDGMEDEQPQTASDPRA